jgi:hypothetical protein
LVGIGRRAVVWRGIRVARLAAGGRTRVVGWVNGEQGARAFLVFFGGRRVWRSRNTACAVCPLAATDIRYVIAGSCG